MQNWSENINTIKEIFPGHFRIVLNFATTKILNHLLRDDYQFVWVINHHVPQSLEWTKNELPVFGAGKNLKVISRNISFDYALPTIEFRSNLPLQDKGITLVQLNKLPGYYVDPLRMKGKTLYDKLKDECDYLFYLDIPRATDYGALISSNRAYLQELLDDISLDWNDLP